MKREQDSFLLFFSFTHFYVFVPRAQTRPLVSTQNMPPNAANRASQSASRRGRRRRHAVLRVSNRSAWHADGSVEIQFCGELEIRPATSSIDVGSRKSARTARARRYMAISQCRRNVPCGLSEHSMWAVRGTACGGWKVHQKDHHDPSIVKRGCLPTALLRYGEVCAYHSVLTPHQFIGLICWGWRIPWQYRRASSTPY